MSMKTEMTRRTKSDSDMTNMAPWSPKHGAGTSINNDVSSPPRPVLLGPTIDVKAPPMQVLEAGCSEITEITEIVPSKSESCMMSMSVSSPRSPNCAAATNKIHYYLQSPSHYDGDGGYKSSLMQATPSESPSHPSFGHHSWLSSVSCFSRILFGGGRNLKPVNTKGWPECNVIQEEGSYKGLYRGDSGRSLRCKIMLVFSILVIFITGICIFIWGAARPYIPDVDVKTIAIDHFYASEGTDHTGVPSKLVSLNCSVNMVVYNPASMFGIHVASSPVLLLYTDIAIGVGQVRKYYQTRNSHRRLSVVIHGHKVPLYGAGGGLDLSSNDRYVPLTLDFVLISRGYVISQLVWVTHNVHITCNITVDAKATRPIRFPKDACAVYKV